MNVFKYMMNVLRTRLNAEWQALDVAYPQWLTRIVMDETCYAVTMIAVCANCFVMGLVIGFIVALA